MSEISYNEKSCKAIIVTYSAFHNSKIGKKHKWNVLSHRDSRKNKYVEKGGVLDGGSHGYIKVKHMNTYLFFKI